MKLPQIITTAGTQIRAKIDADTVDQYAEAMKDASNKFPPVVVFHDGNQHILADGFHRVMAAARNDFLDVLADVRNGTATDALRYALSANAAHGLRRTNADKRRSVELALAKWPKLSDREIARVCAVGHPFVGDVRAQLVSDSSCPETPDNSTRIGADGKKRRLPKRIPSLPSLEPGEPPHVIAQVEVMNTNLEPLTVADLAMIRSSFKTWLSQWATDAQERDAVLRIVTDELTTFARTAA